VCVYSSFLSSNPAHGKRRSPIARERGVILIAVLLIVAIVAGLGIKFASQYQLGLARAESRWHGTQARQFLEGTEEVAKLLFPEADLDPNTDYLGEPWNNPVPIEEEGVTGVAQLMDATSQLNLNDLGDALVGDKPIGSPERYKEPQRRFIRLLQSFPELPISQQDAEGLLEAIVDWIDPDDNESGMYGAESNYYQGLADPYLAANALFKSVDELRLVRGFNENPELVNVLLPFITVLPGNAVGININTIEATINQETANGIQQRANNLIRSLGGVNDLTPLSDEDAVQFMSMRPETGFPDNGVLIEEWTKIFGDRNLDGTGLNLKSGFFWLNASVQMGDQRRSMRSLMLRGEENKLKVIQREDVYELPRVVNTKEKKKSSSLFSN